MKIIPNPGLTISTFWNPVCTMTKKLLTFHKNYNRPGGRWRKYVNNKVMYFGSGKDEYNQKSYQAAVKKYLQYLQKLEASEPVEVVVSDATLKEVAEKYLQDQHCRYERNEISATSFDKCRNAINYFCKQIKSDKRFTQVSELDLNDYRNHLLNLPVSEHTNKPIALSTAKARLDQVKAFYMWAYELRLCELPRNLKRLSKIELPSPIAETFTMKELKLLWKHADQRLKAFIALALNCGYGSADLSDLKPAHLVDGYIEKPRKKTGVLCRHKLWDVTLELLFSEADNLTQLDQPIFTGKNGKQLVHSRIDEEGKMKHTDSIKSRFWRLQKKAGIKKVKGFYCLRKTAATEIERIDPLVTEMFLGHSMKGMKKHYVQRNWESLDAAVEEMEELLGLS